MKANDFHVNIAKLVFKLTHVTPPIFCTLNKWNKSLVKNSFQQR